MIELLAQGLIAGVVQQCLDIAVERQQRRNRTEALHLDMNRLGVEFELAGGLLAALGPGALLGDAPSPVHAQQQAGQNQRDDEGDAVAAGQGNHDRLAIAESHGKAGRASDSKTCTSFD